MKEPRVRVAGILVEDKNRTQAVLLQNEWSIRHLVERNEGIVLKETSL